LVELSQFARQHFLPECGFEKNCGGVAVNEIIVERARPDEYETVGLLVNRLLIELFPDDDAYRAPGKHISAAKYLLESGDNVWALVAKNTIGEIVGILTLNECAAIYAGGNFGEISELYVDSSQRSSGVGAKLIDAARQFGIQKGWPEIEVGALPQPEWKRTSNYSATSDLVKKLNCYRFYWIIRVYPSIRLQTHP
jgi:GNAT superfamily N-acetyltransferase